MPAMCTTGLTRRTGSPGIPPGAQHMPIAMPRLMTTPLPAAGCTVQAYLDADGRRRRPKLLLHLHCKCNRLNRHDASFDRHISLKRAYNCSDELSISSAIARDELLLLRGRDVYPSGVRFRAGPGQIAKPVVHKYI